MRVGVLVGRVKLDLVEGGVAVVKEAGPQHEHDEKNEGQEVVQEIEPFRVVGGIEVLSIRAEEVCEQVESADERAVQVRA